MTTLKVRPPNQAVVRKISKHGQNRTGWLLAGPGTLLLVLAFIAPMAYMLRMSFNIGKSAGVIVHTISGSEYQTFLTSGFHWGELFRTLEMSVIVMVATLLVSYPIALFLARTKSRWKSLLTVLAIAPLLTSSVVRTYGWIALLGPTGAVNYILLHLRIISTPLPLANHLAGVEIALVEIMMPYMIVALLAGFGSLSEELDQAAATLGAGPWQRFRRITVPLTLPGIATGCLLVFVLSISSFVTPDLLGGGRVFVMATEIYQQATLTLNWPFAAAVSFILLVLFGVVITLYQRTLRSADKK